MSLQEDFLQEIERFLVAYGMKPTPFGRASMKDPNLVWTLRAGRCPNADVIDRVRAFMAQYATTHQSVPRRQQETGEAA